MQVVNEFLKRHGSEEDGDCFLGATYSAAETITTPFVRRMLLVLPALRDLDVDAILKEEGLGRLDRWFKVSATGSLKYCEYVFLMSFCWSCWSSFKFIIMAFWWLHG